MRHKTRSVRRRFPALLWAAAFALAAASCGAVEEQSTLPARAAAPQSSAPSTATEPDPTPTPAVEMAKVAGGLFVYGASEQQFQIYLAQSKVGFPGMKDLFHNALVIPPVSLNLPDFWMDAFEVSNRQFSQFLVATGYQPKSWTNFLKNWNGSRYPDWAADFPVVWVSVADAEAFCRWRGGRLPSDEEWEKADRGPSGQLFPWGNDLPDPETTNCGTGKIEPVGNRPGDCSVYGIYDLAGNVSELTLNRKDSSGHSGYFIRGGSYQTGIQSLLGFHRSLGSSREERSETVGFRCVMDHVPVGAGKDRSR